MWMNPEERLKENPVLKNQFDGLHAYFDEKVVPLASLNMSERLAKLVITMKMKFRG